MNFSWNSQPCLNTYFPNYLLHHIQKYLPILEGQKFSFETWLLVDRFEDLMFQKFVSREDLALSTLWNGRDLIVERQRGNSSLIWHGRLRNTSNLNFSASQWDEIIYVVAIKKFPTCIFTSYFFDFAIIWSNIQQSSKTIHVCKAFILDESCWFLVVIFGIIIKLLIEFKNS